jgi:hypothetical protein
VNLEIAIWRSLRVHEIDMCVCVRACVRACVPACVYICMYVCMYIYIYIYSETISTVSISKEYTYDFYFWRENRIN